MGIGFKRKKGIGSIPVFQGTDKDIRLVQGGFTLVITGLVAGTIIPSGTPMIYNEADRTAKSLSVGVMQANAGGSATAYRVKKGSRLKIGDNLAATIGGKAYPITAIDTTNVAYDELTVGTTIGAVSAEAFVFASSATGATSAAFGGVNGLLYADAEVTVNEPVSIVDMAVVYARRVPYSADLAAALGPLIKYSQSY